jgi:caffeoyl-CoA O-methyltransferase
MSKNSAELHAQTYDYLLSMAGQETPEMVGLREATSTQKLAMMQISPDQGRFMALMVGLLQARNIVEVGTFTGYSALCMALALPDDGRLIACDISDEWTQIGQPYWKSAGVDHKIDLRLAPAIETLSALLQDGYAETFDMAFIDADKGGYDDYYELCLRLLRENGLILIDNVLWGGSVADPDNQEEDTVAIRTLNSKVVSDNRVDAAMISVGDGLFLVRKK